MQLALLKLREKPSRSARRSNMKNRIAYAPCRRCGKILASLIQPIYSSKSTQNKYQFICERCMSNEEKAAMQNETLQTICEKKG